MIVRDIGTDFMMAGEHPYIGPFSYATPTDKKRSASRDPSCRRAYDNLDSVAIQTWTGSLLVGWVHAVD